MVWYGMKNKTTEIRCRKCKNQVGGFDYNWNGGLCNSCKNRRGISLGIILLVIALAISIPFSLFEFNYQLDKCSNLKTTESNYGFTNTVEVNAQFNSHCYFLRNHPLALPSYFLISFMVGFLFGMVGFMIGGMTKPVGFERIDYSYAEMY